MKLKKFLVPDEIYKQEIQNRYLLFRFIPIKGFIMHSFTGKLTGFIILILLFTWAAGETLKTLLSRLTTNRFMGTITGVLNSSSVTTILVVSFITTGTMTLSQSVGVIMGANIGSTVTAQLLAFNLSAYALLPVACCLLPVAIVFL